MERLAKWEDTAALKALWALCFEDTKDFIDWFFSARFAPAYSVVYEQDGKIAACAHSLPVHIRIRGQILPAVLLCGVATHPDYRRRGLSRAVLKLLMHTLRSRGVVLVVHRPARLETYFSIGHYPVADFRYLSLPAPAENAVQTLSDPCTQLDLRADISGLYTCYDACSKGYSLMLSRSYADFALKMADYRSTGAKCAALVQDGVTRAYCVYFEDEERLYGEEFAALDKEACALLYSGMRARAAKAHKALKIRMASNVSIQDAQAAFETLPRCVLGLCNAAALLKTLGLSGGAIEVTDGIVPENAGVYDLRGEKSGAPAQLRIEAGRLLQWASGYRSMREIVDEGNATVLDASILERMDAIGKQACYIVDEY